ncbi:Positive regulator of CheA protein activity (CheW) [Labilithrix luteola]|uniref:Chemotaxis protein CheW n=1 Tax=Labilithrix luteola TaxID=1391654 RepID=A0A0K1PJD2_9BACT|nr:chemotaxis protein CheW [Labilithrix luteola]AKU93653.1 Positive regulator of CheA protein activity (CheW) [Labilithrix luteola]
MNVSSHASSVTAGAQYLSFSLASEQYAVEILRVQEIRGVCPITELPRSAPSVRGVMNLRGAVVPVVDMRSALGLPDEGYGPFTVIIVLSVRGQTVGFVVDSVSDVLSLDESAIERAPDLGGRVDASLVSGIARTQDRFVVLLDIDRVAGLDGEPPY